MKIAFIYGGQGSQVEAMGKDLYEKYSFVKDFYDSIDLDFSIKEMSFQGDLDLISKTEYTQAIMLAFQIAATKVLEFHGIKPDILMGLSLGEYGALYAAEVLDENTLLEIIQYRSKEMAKASKELDSKMLAIFSEDMKRIKELCKTYSTSKDFVEISNINTKGQIVISGNKDIIDKIAEDLKDEKYKFMELNTSGPFHTSYMDQVSEKLKKYFENINFKTSQIPIIHNLYGAFKENLDIKETMSKQVNNPVLFKDSIEELLLEEPNLIVEIGHGNVIRGLVRRIDKKYRPVSINTVESIEKLIEEIEKHGK